MTRGPTTENLGKDNFDNPLMDQLLTLIDREHVDFLNWAFGDWTEQEVREAVGHGDNHEITLVPKKPKILANKTIWQNPLNEILAKGSTNQIRRSLQVTPIGTSDITITFSDATLSCYINGDNHEWSVREGKDISVLHFLCRPALNSVASTMREIQKYRSRKNDGPYGQDVGHLNERFGVLTCNPAHQKVFEGQDVLYVYIPQKDVQEGYAPWN